MLTSNLWTGVGLVNGAMGTVIAICYKSGQAPPNLPVPVMLRFDSCPGPTLPDGTVPIVPIRHTWSASSAQCSRLQLPLKLAWAVTIHKAQGLTLDKVVIDVGMKEFACGLTFVACSRVRTLTDLLFSTLHHNSENVVVQCCCFVSGLVFIHAFVSGHILCTSLQVVFLAYAGSLQDFLYAGKEMEGVHWDYTTHMASMWYCTACSGSPQDALHLH